MHNAANARTGADIHTQNKKNIKELTQKTIALQGLLNCYTMKETIPTHIVYIFLIIRRVELAMSVCRQFLSYRDDTKTQKANFYCR